MFQQIINVYIITLCRILISDINLCEKSCQANIVTGDSAIIGPEKYITLINNFIIGTVNVDGDERVRKRSFHSQST